MIEVGTFIASWHARIPAFAAPGIDVVFSDVANVGVFTLCM